MPPLPLRRAFVARWYVTLAGLILTVAFGVAAAVLVPVQYQAKSVVVLLPPSTKLAANPYTNLSSLFGLSDVLDQSLTSEASTNGIKKAGNVGTYTVTNDLSTSGPLVVVSAVSDTPDHAKQLAKYVTKLIPTQLRELQSQAGIASTKDYITSLTINPVDKVTVVNKNRTRALLVAAAGGLLLTVLFVAGAERIAARRRRRPSAVRPQPPARRSPQPRVSRPSRDVSETDAASQPLPNGVARHDAPTTAVKHSRRRRSRVESEKDHEPVVTVR